MGERQDLILRRLTEEGEATLEFFRGLDEADWERRIYTDGSQWTVRQVLCHFVSAESGFLRLARNILDGGEGAPEGMDIDEFNEGEVGAMADRTPAELLPEFQRLRAEMVQLVRGMSEADFDPEGRHPFFGRSSMEKLLKLIYRHTMIHLRDVRRVL
jgi:uncharacterized protein (TIGR03083 family)